MLNFSYAFIHLGSLYILQCPLSATFFSCNYALLRKSQGGVSQPFVAVIYSIWKFEIHSDQYSVYFNMDVLHLTDLSWWMWMRHGYPVEISKL